jgi:hypothetical protein
VLGRGASFAYRDRPNPARALGQEQGATFVVAGTLEQSAERLRSSAELIDAATGRQLWSERFDRPSGDWAAVRDELGARIGNAVYADAVFPAILDRASGRPLDDLEAHELAVLAREQLGKLTKEANARGLELIDLAQARDPRSSAALYFRCRLCREQVDLDPNYAWGRVVDLPPGSGSPALCVDQAASTGVWRMSGRTP